MKILDNYTGGTRNVRSKNRLLGLWRYAMVLVPLLFLININSYASGNNETCLAPCENLRTQTMGGWGATPTKNGSSPANLLRDNFPGDIVVGCAEGFTLKLTSADAVNKFLPSGSTPDVLKQNWENPTNASEGSKNGSNVYENVLAGQAVALTISLKMFPTSGLADAYVVDPLFYNEPKTVTEVLEIANDILGGCSTDYTPSAINNVLSKINESWVDGKRRSDYLLCSYTKPDVSLSASDPECGKDVTLTAVVSNGKGPFSYKWYDSEGEEITNEDGSSINSSQLVVSESGTYRVEVTDKYGCKDEDEIPVEVWKNPTVTLAADPECDEDTKITASPTGGSGEYTYTWYKIEEGNEIEIEGETSGVLEVEMAGTYKVVVKDENGCEGEDEITVEVYVSPDISVRESVEICEEFTYDLSTAIITLDITGLTITYWDVYPNENDYPLTEEEASSVGVGTYYIKVSNENCSTIYTVVITDKDCNGVAQGCTLGYWKNHTDRWSCYTTETTFGSVFGAATGDLADMKLLDALNLGGGGANNLARQGVAALLNACSSGDSKVNYPLSVDEVKQIVNDGLSGVYNDQSDCNNAGCAANYLDRLNNAGCPLGGSRATNLAAEATSSLQGERLTDSHELRAYPTPFTDKAVIEFRVAQDERFSMRLYDMRGALVRELKSGEAKAGVVNTVEVDGGGLPEGLYIARMVSDSGTKTVKLLKKE